MLPGAIIGDAEPQLGGKRADENLFLIGRRKWVLLRKRMGVNV